MSEHIRITKENLNAMKLADSVILRHSVNGGLISCIKRVEYEEKKNNPYAEDKYYNFKVKSVGGGGEISKLPYGGRNDFKATAWVQPNWEGTFRTVVHYILKVGDIVMLDWRAGYHNNGYVEHAQANWKKKYDDYPCSYSEGQLHADSVFFTIHREGKKNTKIMMFEVKMNVCADNSARMIKVEPETYCLI